MCSDCGCKFPALEDLEQEIQKKKNALKGVGSIFVCCLILLIIGTLIDFSFLKIMGIGCAIFTAILVPLLKKEIKTRESEYAELEQKVKM